MASVSLQDVLGAPQLCGSYETVKSGNPDVFPAGFYTVDQKTEGNKGSYFQVEGQRQLAETVAYGSPSTATQMKGVTEVPVILYHVNKNLTLPMTKFVGLIRKDSSGSGLLIDQKGVDEIGRQVRNAVMLVKNLKSALLAQLLALGNNYFDASGALLPTSTGAKTTSPSQIASGNIGNLTSVLSGATVWSNSAADIEDQIVGLQQLASDATGYDLKYAFAGRNISKYMTSNKKMAAFLARNPAANDAYLRTGVIAELPNMKVVNASKASYRDGSGTTQRLIGDNQIIFTPEPDISWLGWIDGSYPIPSSVDVEKDGMAALANVDFVHGDFMYAQVCTDPVAIKIVYGTTTIPTVRVPKAVYTVDVTA